jgi:hypothetical protein
MVAKLTTDPSANGFRIFERLFFSKASPMSAELARHFLAIEISEIDRARMADLLHRNQANLLSSAEQKELQNLSLAGTVLAVFQSQARRVLKMPPPKPRRKNGHG